MAFTAVVVDPHTEPVPPEWDALAVHAEPRPLWESWMQPGMGWYEQCPSLMSVVTATDGTPVALFHARHLGPPGRPSRFVAARGRGVVGVVEHRLSDATAGHHFRTELDQADRAAVIAAHERAVRRRLRWRCAGFVYRQVTAADVPAFTRRGRVVLQALPDAVVDNEWDTLDDYLASRPPRHRSELLRVRRAVADDPAVTAAVEKDLPAAEFAHLAHIVRTRYQSRWTPPRPPLFYDLLAGHDAARYVTYREPCGRLLAAAMALDDGTSVRVHGWGLRGRADGGRPNLYFDQYLHNLEYVIEHGRERMLMGKTLFDLKARFGARPIPLYVVASVR